LFKGKSIADILGMTVEEAYDFFKAVPSIRDKMATLSRVGLDYVKLGQSATTLSGGEAQRVKLSKELSRRATGRTLYILDEPTTGLHFEDTKKLLEVLHELVDQGNTVVVIEHNLDVVKTADWILDFGPEGGDGGGRIVAEGTPEQVAAGAGESWTGRYLADVLARHEERRKERVSELKQAAKRA
jgi:excinuclease ABC subunit A